MPQAQADERRQDSGADWCQEGYLDGRQQRAELALLKKDGQEPQKKRADGLARSGCLLYSPGVHVSFMIVL